ncbi:hypothetical protein [Dyadobacter bucti]|uniref:hypothetical protein n=1 Tax=Dyadobacter bucti TaxID=2572203 RepID=UPI00110A01D6|nr:hypothetical protein [Dyadobacter bucti]
MKKPITFSLAVMLCAASVSYGQSTTGSVDLPAGQNKQGQTTGTADQNKPRAPRRVIRTRPARTMTGRLLRRTHVRAGRKIWVKMA